MAEGGILRGSALGNCILSPLPCPVACLPRVEQLPCSTLFFHHDAPPQLLPIAMESAQCRQPSETMAKTNFSKLLVVYSDSGDKKLTNRCCFYQSGSLWAWGLRTAYTLLGFMQSWERNWLLLYKISPLRGDRSEAITFIYTRSKCPFLLLIPALLEKREWR